MHSDTTIPTAGARRHCSVNRVIFSARLPLLLLSLLFAGCGPKHPQMAPVKGKVLIDGQPLTFGSVGTLPPSGRGAHGEIQPDGTFELFTYGKHDGALVGLHKVSVAAYEQSGKKDPESGYGKLMTPKKYGDPQSSGLTIDVQPGGNYDVVLELTSKDQKKK
jgi:hypothetical protein